MILYMYFDDWGRAFANRVQGAICLDATAGKAPDDVLNDMSHKLAKVLAPNPPAFAVLLPCRFFAGDDLPQERTGQILIRAAERFKDTVAGIPNLVLPCLYTDDLLRSEPQDDKSRTGRKSLEEFLVFLNGETAQKVRNVQNPFLDRVFVLEKVPYHETPMDQDAVFNCLENFIEVIRKDGCSNLLRISIVKQLPFFRVDPAMQEGENIPFYGTLRMQKMAHPKSFFVARQAGQDFLQILRAVTDKNNPLAGSGGATAEPAFALPKPQITIEKKPLDLVPDWVKLKNQVYPQSIAGSFGNELIKIREGVRGVFPYSFGAWLRDRKSKTSVPESLTKNLMDVLSDRVGRAPSFPKAEVGIDAAVKTVDEELQRLQGMPQWQDGADGIRQPWESLREARKSLDTFLASEAVQERQHNQWGLLFLFPLLFPLLGWLSSLTLSDYGSGLPALGGIFADVLIVGAGFWALNMLYRRKEEQLRYALREALDRMKLKLGARCNACQEHLRDLHWLKYSKELNYFLHRMKLRYAKLETYTHLPAATLKNKFASPFRRREDRFFKHIFNAGDIDTEERCFSETLAMSSHYIQAKQKWPAHFMARILDVLFSPPSHQEFLAIFGDAHRDVVLDIDNATGGGNLMELIDGGTLKDIMKKEVPAVANVPVGILVDASRGGNIAATYYQVYLCQASVMGGVPIDHAGFGPGPERWDMLHNEPSIIIGHLAVGIRARDFCPQE